MVKTKIVETTEKYDEDGKLVEKITREETSEDDTVYSPSTPWIPLVTQPLYGSGKPFELYCTVTITNADNVSFGEPVDVGTV